jgi:hypothetical protein
MEVNVGRLGKVVKIGSLVGKGCSITADTVEGNGSRKGIGVLKRVVDMSAGVVVAREALVSSGTSSVGRIAMSREKK